MDTPTEQTISFKQRSRTILIALIFPTMAIIFNGSVFGVALPTIRDHFVIEADVVAWLAIAFSLPFMMLMPLYGRLGDQLGKARLLTLGIFILCVGTLLIFVADSLIWVFIGRFIQGAGSAGITPLSLAIIASRFPEEERGRALGIWNSTAPGTSIFAPSIGGFIVDMFGWRMIFLPVLLLSILALIIVRWQIPSLRGKPNWQILRHFDWGGVLFLNGALIFLVAFLSSRPITGIDPLRDWRLLLGVVLFTAVFIIWERRQSDPLIDLNLLKSRNFTRGALTSSFRMGMMVGPSFIMALYLTDIYGFNASRIGFFATIHSIALFIFIRIGGNLADTRSRRNLIIIGLLGQLSVMSYFALLPVISDLIWLYVGIIAHGMSAGLSIISMHRKALDSVAESQSGAAAGIYSMTRFGGSMIATTLIGVVLQWGEGRGFAQIDTYHLAFGVLVIYGLLGVVAALGLEKTQNRPANLNR